MKTLEEYSKLTIRISKEVVFEPKIDDGHGYQYFARCDEIPGCCVHGSTISDVFQKFQKLAELWINLAR